MYDPLGVSYCATVRIRPWPSSKPYTACTSPLPNVRSPRSTARQSSCRAPANTYDIARIYIHISVQSEKNTNSSNNNVMQCSSSARQPKNISKRHTPQNTQ